MNTPKPFLSFLYILLLFHISGYERVEGHSVFKAKTLFVFGDSFVDTGNNPITTADSWKFPYGINFPGKPTGRYSDGRVSSDFFARFLGIRSPIPYRWRDYSPPEKLKNGMNFAYGGAGVFDTIYRVPNTTLQLDFFENIIRRNIYSAVDFKSSVALINVGANDYTTYVAANGSQQGLKPFMTKLVNQLELNMKRIHRLGVKKIVVAAVPAVGCLPQFTAASGYRLCNKTTNSQINFHNILLRQATAKLNKETNNNGETTFIILDIYRAFLTVLEKGGGIKFGNPLLRPCCVGKSRRYNCGSVDNKGFKMYNLCKDPKRSFFWDNVHPSQEAWRAIYSVLLSNFTLS